MIVTTPASRKPPPPSSQYVQTFLEQRVRYEAQGEVELILATPNADDLAIQTFEPRIFNGFGKRRNFDTIGSGAEFVHRAIGRDQAIGIVFNNTSLAHLLVQIGYFAEAANESLTVDDKFLLGILANNRTYLLGDINIIPSYAPAALTQAWPQASTRVLTYLAQAKLELGFERTVVGVIAAFVFPREIRLAVNVNNLGIELVEIPPRLCAAGFVPTGPSGCPVIPVIPRPAK